MILLLVQAAAKPERSALRGGSEQVGLGPRPKLHVKWHPDVFDPICSTVSHTVGHNKTGPAFISRRSYQKHLRQKSKGSSKSQGRGKKQDSSHKSKKKSEPSKSRWVIIWVCLLHVTICIVVFSLPCN